MNPPCQTQSALPNIADVALTFEIPVTFRVNSTAASDVEVIKVAGNHQKLGEWEPASALILRENVLCGPQILSAAVFVQAGLRIEYKFVKVNKVTGKVVWEGCENRSHSVLNLEQPEVVTPTWEI